MLAYLDALLEALSVRDAAAADRLLAHPLVRILPEGVRDEVRAILAGAGDPLAAPLRLMQLRHMTAQLLHVSDDAPVVVDAPEMAPAERPPREHVAERCADDPAPEPTRPQPVRHRRTGRLAQMELPLSA